MTLSSDASVIFRDPAFMAELQQAASAAGKTMEKAERYAHKCLTEIEATPSDAWLQPMAKFARFIYTRSYEVEMHRRTADAFTIIILTII